MTHSMVKSKHKTWKQYDVLRTGDNVKIAHNPGVLSGQAYVVTDIRLGGEPLYELGGFHHSLPRHKLRKFASRKE